VHDQYAGEIEGEEGQRDHAELGQRLEWCCTSMDQLMDATHDDI
jgi:hypothetical protein